MLYLEYYFSLRSVKRTMSTGSQTNTSFTTLSGQRYSRTSRLQIYMDSLIGERLAKQMDRWNEESDSKPSSSDEELDANELAIDNDNC